MLYSRSSELSVKNINQAVEVLSDPVAAIQKKINSLKDPTQINENFRQALKNSRVGTSSDIETDRSAPLPVIHMVGKIYHPQSPRELLTGKASSDARQQSTVILEIDSEVIPLHEGDSASYIKNNQVYTIEVKAITPYSVTLILNPGQQQLVFH